MPLVSPEIIEPLIDSFEHHPTTKAVAPVREGQRGNPVLLSRALFPAVAALSGDVGARALLAAAQGESVILLRRAERGTLRLDQAGEAQPWI